MYLWPASAGTSWRLIRFLPFLITTSANFRLLELSKGLNRMSLTSGPFQGCLFPLKRLTLIVLELVICVGDLLSGCRRGPFKWGSAKNLIESSRLSIAGIEACTVDRRS